jgi:hypothetical protein
VDPEYIPVIAAGLFVGNSVASNRYQFAMNTISAVYLPGMKVRVLRRIILNGCLQFLFFPLPLSGSYIYHLFFLKQTAWSGGYFGRLPFHSPFASETLPETLPS